MAASKVYRLIWRAVPALAAGLLGGLLGCASRGSDTLPSGRADNPPPPAGAPSLTELQQQLDAEFLRLGIDPSKVTAAAPQGARNAVFDLTAQAVDADGQPWTPGDEGADPPAGIELSWTERLLGDYDQNGEVNAADLAPIAARFLQTVSYDAPTLHGGFDEWPSGDPEGSGAANWRNARVDGDGNGEINAADIATIAGNWRAAVSGYRIYRRGPGDVQPQLLANLNDPESKYTVKRPSVNQLAPVRFGFIDQPPNAGLYEYEVVAYSIEGGASDARSNVAQAELAAGYADRTAPVWDDLDGIAVATANPDGTVTVEFGTATDVAMPPAPASPPVSYSLCYSLGETIDFATAVRLHDIASPYTSQPLLNGQTYSFAVRARDNAQPPNEDQNERILTVAVTGGAAQDTEPPIVDEAYLAHTGMVTFHSVEVKDGKLVIRCPPAHDLLSPPVRYDLVYLAGPEGPLATHLGGNIWEINPQAQVIENIPAEYEFAWPNRKDVWLGLRLRDSAQPPNYFASEVGGVAQHLTAPSDALQVELDTSRPYYQEGIDTPFGGIFVDVSEKIVYRTEHPRLGNEKTKDVWLTKISMETGHWTTKRIYTHNVEGEGVSIGNPNPTKLGGFFVRINFNSGLGKNRWETWRMTKDGQLQNWPPGDTNWTFIGVAHNGYPAYYKFVTGENKPNYYAVRYKWFDPESDEFVEEVACDPGGSPRFLFRPDGVVQLVCSRLEGIVSAPEAGMSVHERSSDGIWTEVLRRPFTSEQFSPSAWMSPFHWDVPWTWSAYCPKGTANTADDELLIYGNGGYTWLSTPQGHIFNWPAVDGPGHILTQHTHTLWKNGEPVTYNVRGRNYHHLHKTHATSRHSLLGVTTGINYFDPLSGHFVFLVQQPDPSTGEMKEYWRLSTPSSNLYSPLSSDWQD